MKRVSILIFRAHCLGCVSQSFVQASVLDWSASAPSTSPTPPRDLWSLAACTHGLVANKNENSSLLGLWAICPWQKLRRTAWEPLLDQENLCLDQWTFTDKLTNQYNIHDPNKWNVACMMCQRTFWCFYWNNSVNMIAHFNIDNKAS